MKPDQKKSDDELRSWTGGIIAREQGNRMFGTVTVHMEAGRIVRVSTQRTELPPSTLPPE